MWLAEGALGQASRGHQIQRAGCLLSVSCHSQGKSAGTAQEHWGTASTAPPPATGMCVQAEAGWLLGEVSGWCLTAAVAQETC